MRGGSCAATRATSAWTRRRRSPACRASCRARLGWNRCRACGVARVPPRSRRCPGAGSSSESSSSSRVWRRSLSACRSLPT
ncbi:MAG: hypothetical protein F4Y98_08805 [Chloroflexi bacterium]|nr:hypothetical protein [Chloroflexota bacterium]